MSFKTSNTKYLKLVHHNLMSFVVVLVVVHGSPGFRLPNLMYFLVDKSHLLGTATGMIKE